MLRKLEIGDPVIFVDSHGVEHNALTTNVFGQLPGNDPWMFKIEPGWAPCVNLIYVVKDEKKTDSHGQQMARESSVVHAVNQPAGRYCFKFPDGK